jgi:ubiquinone/menaquinone biosynthesis C-methylase UbiE
MQHINPTKIPGGTQEMLWQRAVDKLRKDGKKRVALYGAGRHSLRFLGKWSKSKDPAFVLLLDDNTKGCESKFGLPLRCPADLTTADADAVLCSSDGFEENLYKAAAPLADRGIPIYRIYHEVLNAESSLDEAGNDTYQDIFEAIALWNPEAYHMRDGLTEKNAIIYHRYSRSNIHDIMYRALEKQMPCPKRILDVGSGRGYDTQRLAGQFPSAEVVGLEYAEAGVELSQKYKTDRLRFVQGDAMSMPFDDGQFDMAFSMATIEHVADPKKMVEQIYRVLKPGGIALVATHPEHYWRFWQKGLAESTKAQAVDFEFHGLMVDSMKQLFTDAGFAHHDIGFTGLLPLQGKLKYFQGIDFKMLFGLLRTAGWVLRHSNKRQTLYYQYHLVRKGSVLQTPKSLVEKSMEFLASILARPIYSSLCRMRDRLEELDG